MKKTLLISLLILSGAAIPSLAAGPLLKPMATRGTADPLAPATNIPGSLIATDFKDDGFTAQWSPVTGAGSYLLNLYKKKVEEAVVYQDFEGLNIIPGTNLLDTSDPGFTDGWTIGYGQSRNKDHVSNLGYEGSTGMIFRNTGEGFETPVFENPICDFSFWAVYPSGEPCLSTLVVTVLVNGEWGALGNFDIERISPEGEIINLSQNLPEGGVNAIQVMFKKNEYYDNGKNLDVIIDHIRLQTYPEGELVKGDIPATGNSYTFTGLEPESDYAFTVRSVKGSDISDESPEKMAVGLSAPVLKEATNIGKGSYTANWCYAPKSEGYQVNSYKVYTVASDWEYVDILHETFDKVTEGTLTNPVGLYNVAYPRALDEYTENPGWMGIATYLVKGMLGSRNYYIINGIIQTPALNLSGDNGRFDVTVTVVGDSDAIDEELVVQAGQTTYQTQPIKPEEPVTLEFTFDCGEEQMLLGFYTRNGFPFYLDEVTVSQELPKGSQVAYLMKETTVKGADNLSAEISGLELGANENPAYRVFSYRDFMGGRVYSLSNSVEHVIDMASVDSLQSDEEDATAVYYTISGVKVGEKPLAPGIYVRVKGNKSEKIILK